MNPNQMDILFISARAFVARLVWVGVWILCSFIAPESFGQAPNVPSHKEDRIKNLNLSSADLAVFPEDAALLSNPVWEAELQVSGPIWIKPPKQDYEPFPLTLESRPMRLPRVGVELGLDWDGETVLCKTSDQAFMVTSDTVPGLVTFVPPFSVVRLKPNNQAWLDLAASEGNDSDIRILYRTPNAEGAAFTGARLLAGIPAGSSGRFDLFKNKSFTFRALQGELWTENLDGARSKLIPEAPPAMGGPRITVRSGPFQTPRLVQVNPFQELSLEVIPANDNVLDGFRNRSEKNSVASSMTGRRPSVGGGSDSNGNNGRTGGNNEGQASMLSDRIGSQATSESTFETQGGLTASGTGAQTTTSSAFESQGSLTASGGGTQAATSSTFETQGGLTASGAGTQAATSSTFETQGGLTASGAGTQAATSYTFEAQGGLTSSGIGTQPATSSISETQSGLNPQGGEAQKVSGQILWERIEVTFSDDQQYDVVGGVTEVIEDPVTGALMRMEMDQENGSVSIRVEKGAFQVNIPQYPYLRPLLYSGQQIIVSFTVGADSIEIKNPSSERLINGPLDGVLLDCANQVFMFLQVGADLIYNPIEAPSKFLVSSSSPMKIYNQELDKIFILKFQVGFLRNGVLYEPGKELNSEDARAIGYHWNDDELVIVTEFGDPVTISNGAMAKVSPDGIFEMQIRNERRNSIEFVVESGKFEMIPKDLVGWVFRIGTGNSLEVDYNQSIGRLIIRTLPGHQGVSQVKTPDGTMVNLESGGLISFKIKGGSVNLGFAAGGGVRFETPTGFPTNISGFPMDVPAGPDGRSMSAFNSSGFSTFFFETERVVQGPISGEEP